MKLCERRGLSPSRLASHLSLGKSTIHNYCYGVLPRGLESLRKIADFFDLSMQELIFEDLDNPSRTTECNIEGTYEFIIKKKGE